MIRRQVVLLVHVPAFLILLMASAFAAAASPAAGDPASNAVLRFDFGGRQSPVEPGWLPVNEATVYSKDCGYGWRETKGIEGVDRTEGYPVTRDFVTAAAEQGAARHTFLVDVPKGRYAVAVVAGDRADRVSPFRILAQGSLAASRVGTGAKGGWDAQTFMVDVDGGPLELTLEAEQAWTLSALVVAPAEQVAQAQETVEQIEDLFAKGSPALVEGLRERQPDQPASTISMNAERVRRGYEVFHCPTACQVFRTTVPQESEVTRQLKLMATPSEWEAASIAVHALQPLRGVRVAVSDLTGPGGSIPAGLIDVKVVRCWPQLELRWQKNDQAKVEYMVVPDMIEPQDRHGEIWIRPNRTCQFWLTVHVPEAAKPGTYRGNVTVSAADRPSTVLALELEVLPFLLQQPKRMALGMYYRPARDASDAAILAELRNMREHGMNSLAFDLASRGKVKDRDGETWDLKRLRWMMGLLRQAGGFDGPFPVHMPVPAQEVTDETRAYIHGLVAAIEAARAENGWPEVLYYPVDEPFRGPKLDRAAALYRAFKEMPNIRTYCTVAAESVRQMGNFVDVHCYALSPAQEFVWPDAWKNAVDRGAEFWWYSNSTRHYLDVIRFKAGFFHWKSRSTGQFYWHYCGPGDSEYCDFDGRYRDHVTVYRGLDGPIDSVLWENLREGLDDARYAWTLEAVLEQAQKRDSAAPAVARAKKLLEEIRGKIETDLKFYDAKYAPRSTAFHYNCEWKPEEFPQARERLARAIVDLLP